MSYNKNFISSIHFLDKREILSQVLDVQNEDPSFLDVMEGMRRSVPTSSAIFHNYVNEPVYEKLTLTGTAAGDNLTNAKIRKGDVIVDVANNTMWFVKNNASLEGSTSLSLVVLERLSLTELPLLLFLTLTAKVLALLLA